MRFIALLIFCSLCYNSISQIHDTLKPDIVMIWEGSNLNWIAYHKVIGTDTIMVIPCQLDEKSTWEIAPDFFKNMFSEFSKDSLKWMLVGDYLSRPTEDPDTLRQGDTIYIRRIRPDKL